MRIWNIYIITVLLSLGMLSCKVKQAVADTNTVIIDDTDNSTLDNNSNNEDNNTKVNTSDIKPDTIINIEPALNLKDEYNVALILPLLSDSIFSNWSNHNEDDLEDFRIPNTSEEALNFLEGAMMALEKLELNSNVNLMVYDNQYSFSQTNLILNKLELEDVDLIIGPLKKQNIELVSKFAKKKDIMMLSPFSPSKSAGSKYYKYIMAEPTIDLHFKTIAEFIADSLSNSSVKILHPNTNIGIKNAFEIETLFKSINDSLDLINQLNYAMIEVELNTNDRKNFKIEDYLDTDKDNTVIVLSYNEGFIHSMLTSLNTQLKVFDIKVFGMPNWKNSKSLRLDYFENLNVHYTDSKWIDIDEFKTASFVNDFKSKYKAHPKEAAFLAYDLFSFFPVWLEKYGLDLDENISKEIYQGLINNYHFVPLDYNIESTATLSPRIENVNLHVIEYKNYELILNK